MHTVYSFSKDTRANKKEIIPLLLQKEDLTLAKWNESSIRIKLENKFNQKGWFKCVKQGGIYTQLAFGNPISFDVWIAWVKIGDVFFDSGMFQGNSRNYSQWRANNTFWDKLITERY
ncbi:MAG: LlaMI family restriction endonuclease [Methylococcales bacterium]